MSEQDLELLITLDDPGEDDVGADTFHNLQVENTSQPFFNKERPDKQQMILCKAKAPRGEEL